MQVLSSNNHKIYNLSAGKSLPQWISSKKRRKLEQKDVDIRRRIQLMQDCEMPSVSHTTCFSRDGRYLLATGAYKPTVKCFDLDELSLKYARGLDADVIKMIVFSDDDSKFVLLEEDRFIEFHTMYGRYFRMRIPRYGRDMAFCTEISELYIAGSTDEIYRVNLEYGRFMQPLKCDSESLNCCTFNTEHQLFVCGNGDGKVEAWDHRDSSRVATLDCVCNNGIALGLDAGETPGVTSIQFKGALNMGVGLSTGHVLLYDIRSTRPYTIKDHRMGLPIKRIEFTKSSDDDLVLSMDGRALKMWYEISGEPFAAIESSSSLNDFCTYPNSGLICFANDTPKIQQFFVPSLGPAPKWCSYLESITDELEEVEQPAIYDDYKFLTRTQLEEIGLTHLVGTNMLRAYMHGYFMDVRLYEQARTLTQPMAFENYKKRKLQEYIEDERKVQLINKKEVKLPKVNKELALKLQNELSMDDQVKKKAARKADKISEAGTSSSIYQDERFQKLFTDSNFEIDPSSEEYKRMLPKLKKLEAKKARKEEEEIRRTAQARMEADNGADFEKRFEETGDSKSRQTFAFDFGRLDDSDDDEDLI